MTLTFESLKRYCVIRRSSRGGMLYCHDLQTGKRESLKTKDFAEAERLVHAKNEALRQPFMNLQIARAYLAGVDEAMLRRIWNDVFASIIELKQGSTQIRWNTAWKDKAFARILKTSLIETTSEDFLNVLKVHKVSTTLHLRKLYNFALDMDWLPKAIICRKTWPVVKYLEKRAITFSEHQRILSRQYSSN